MKSVGFKLKNESNAIRKIRLVFYIIAVIYLVFDIFFSLGLYLILPGALQIYTIPMLIFCGCVLLSIIFVRLRLYITSTALLTVATVGTLCIGFMLRNPTVLDSGMTFDAISKEMLMFNFLPVIVPFVAMLVLLFPALSARHAQRLDEELTYEPQFK